jgi:uncharacterized protein (DUF2141 family)
VRLKVIVLAGVLAACVGAPVTDQIARSSAGGSAATLPPSSILPPSSAASELRVVVEGIRSGSGTIMVGLYDTSEGFAAAIKHSTEAGLLNDKGRRVGMALRAAAGVQTIVFADLPPRRYAIIVFHDENDNGRLDENAWGVPTEGYGFSNNAQGFLGAPSFAAAGITLGEKNQSIAISLIYPKVLAEFNFSDQWNAGAFDK